MQIWPSPWSEWVHGLLGQCSSHTRPCARTMATQALTLFWLFACLCLCACPRLVEGYVSARVRNRLVWLVIKQFFLSVSFCLVQNAREYQHFLFVEYNISRSHWASATACATYASPIEKTESHRHHHHPSGPGNDDIWPSFGAALLPPSPEWTGTLRSAARYYRRWIVFT